MAWLPGLVRSVGTILVIGAGTVAGFGTAARLEDELKELERLELGLLCLSSEIAYSLLPLPSALKRAGEQAGGMTGLLLSRTGALTGLAQRRTPVDALDLALSDQSLSRLPSFEVGLLRELAANLGVSGHKEEARFIEMSIERARSHRREFEEECRKKARIYRYLGLLSGACVAIVLL